MSADWGARVVVVVVLGGRVSGEGLAKEELGTFEIEGVGAEFVALVGGCCCGYGAEGAGAFAGGVVGVACIVVVLAVAAGSADVGDVGRWFWWLLLSCPPDSVGVAEGVGWGCLGDGQRRWCGRRVSNGVGIAEGIVPAAETEV